MEDRYCSQCGHENPADARFCMNCGHDLRGHALNGRDAPHTVEGIGPGTTGGTVAGTAASGGTDWAEIAAAGLAILSLRHMSRKARQTAIAITFLVLFFGCPMACGTVMFIVESITRLFQ